MQIGAVIRKYRIEKNMTQEEMANRLGVTPPAVNKWENEKSLPDISLLAPIARLLGISVDTLLSFHDELTTVEINHIIKELDKKLKTQAYDEVFWWAKKTIESYPNCGQLIWQAAVVLDARRQLSDGAESEEYDKYICSWYMRALNSEEENIRNSAADALFSFYSRKGNYEKAEEYLKYFSEQNPERKRKKAQIYAKTGRREEAYTAYEELLFSGYQTLSMVFCNLYSLAMQDKDTDKARFLLEKHSALVKVFDMGKYHEISNELDFVTAKKDVENTISVMRQIMENIHTIYDFVDSPLYTHMVFRKADPEFAAQLKENLMKCFRDEETYGYMKENEQWKALTGFRS